MDKPPKQTRASATSKSSSRRAAAFGQHPSLILAALLVLVLAVAAWQGSRVRYLRESELFYRWILAEAIRARVFQDQDQDEIGPNAKKMMDRKLFQEVVDATENVLPEVADEDTDQDGKPLSKLAVLIRDGTEDRLIWSLASGPALATQRETFLRYLREKRLSPVSSQFDPDAVYGEAAANVGISNMFFGFRKVAANFVWLQVDRYWHQGMMHRMVPLMKTCVALDPQFIDAFLVGAWHLAYNATAHMIDTPEPLKEWHPKYKVRLGEKELYYYMAIDFLKDGIRKNPRNYKLYFDLGFGIYKIKLKDYANAVRYLSEAIRHRHDKWVPRQLYQCLELNGQYKEALAGWQDYLRKYPDNLVARRFIQRNKGLIKERDAEEAFKRARTTEDPLEAQIGREEGKLLYAEARVIWEEMNEPFAMGRILRMDALEYIEKGLYLEAIAFLEHARWESDAIWEEACDMIIETKIKAGIPLSQSEQMAVQRKKDAEKYKDLPTPEEVG